jgi:hypothetical protein
MTLAAAAVAAKSLDAAALELPQTSIAYRIEASLDPATRMLKGTEEIRWTNRTGEPISRLPVHLYLNAFSHARTTWMRGVAAQRLQFGDLLAREPDPWGHIDPLTVRQRTGGGERDATLSPVQPDDGNPLDRSLAELALPEPIAPGGEAVITITFEARLPVPIARTGGARDYFLVAQWYPKIGVIEPAGVRHALKARSAARQFHGPTEFYADFADYDVTFGVPAGWLLGATGRAEGEPQADGSGVKFHYKQRAVHDFAIVTGKTLTDQVARHNPKGGGPPVDVRYIVPIGAEHQIPRWRRAIEGALDVFGSRIGPYPYETLTVVSMPWWANRTTGMEYPTFITGMPGDPLLDTLPLSKTTLPEGVVVHEFGHQYFYGLLASNEQEEAFLDEGFNSYWEQEAMRTIYGEEASEGYLFGRRVGVREMQIFNLSLAADDLREPMRKKPSWLMTPGTTSAQFYQRSSSTWSTAAALFGQEKIDKVFAEYFRRFAFKHPDADDVLAVATEAGGPELALFMKEAFERERLPDYAVTDVTSERWEPPLGRVMTDNGPVVITRANRSQYPETGLPAEARETDGRVLVEITDAGWARGGQSSMGTVARILLTKESGQASPSHRPDGFHESYVRVAGPAWDTLPVTVEVRFADGAIVRDRWDGRAAWRTYRFLRQAPVVNAKVDPEGKIFVDTRPDNNGLSRSADSRLTADWGAWLGAAAQWLEGGLSLWL